MSEIRKQTIVSTILIYIGFAIGFVNVYMFTKQGNFTTAEYGLTGIFIAIASLIFGFASMGMLSVIYKFSPYYKDHVPARKNDLITWALLTSIFGFIIVAAAGYFFKDLVIRKFSENSPLLIKYYFWLFPFGFGLTIFSLLEAVTWSIKKSVVTSFLRETIFRLLITLLIIFYLNNWISSFDVFIKFYAFLYLLLVIILVVYLISKKKLHLSFSISKVTKRLFKKMATFASLLYVANLVFISGQFIDSIIIAAIAGLNAVGLFTLATNISGLVQVPQRAIIATTIPVLAESWKNKDYTTIQRLYQRSSINLLITAVVIFFLIWLNFTDGVITFNLKEEYVEARWIFFFLGIAKIIDLGTGVNSQIIGTSNFWKFELFSGILLLLLMIPLNYFLVKKIGIIGAGISNIISFSIYNGIRIGFLYKKFKMQPFSIKTLIVIGWSITVYFITYWIFQDKTGIPAMAGRSFIYLLLFIPGIFLFKLTPDALQLYYKYKHKWKI